MTEIEAAMPGLRRALGRHPLRTAQELQDEIDTGHARLLRRGRSAVMAKRVEYDTGEVVLECGPADGDLKEIIEDMRPDIEEWARAIGCTQIHVVAGREGWRRPLEAEGYELAQIVMRKILT